MVLFSKIFERFCDHAAILNDDPSTLQREVELVQKKVGPWVRVRGFTDFQQLFLALRVAKAKKHPFSVAYIREDSTEAGELVLRKTDPSIKTVKYSDTQNLVTLMPATR